MLIAVIGLFQEAAAAEIDITHQSSAPSPSYVPISEGLTAPAPPVWFWTGFYGGLHLGVAAGAANFANPLSPSIFGMTLSPLASWPAARSGSTGNYQTRIGYWVSRPTQAG